MATARSNRPDDDVDDALPACLFTTPTPPSSETMTGISAASYSA